MSFVQDRSFLDNQSRGEAFDQRRADMWFRIAATRELLEKNGYAEFVSLRLRESDRGTLLGIRIFEMGRLRRRRWVADIVLLNDRGDPEGYGPLPGMYGAVELHQMFQEWHPKLSGFSIEITFRRRFPKQVFETGNSLDFERNAGLVAAEFHSIVKRLLPIVGAEKSSQVFPAEWKGMGFSEAFIVPNRQKIVTWLVVIGLVVPVSMVFGKLLSFQFLMTLLPTFVFGMAIAVWIPGLPLEPVGRLTRYFCIAAAAFFITTSWWNFLTGDRTVWAVSDTSKKEIEATR